MGWNRSLSPLLGLATIFACLSLNASPARTATASVQSVVIASDEKLQGARWMYGKGHVPTAGAVLPLLAKAKKAQLDREFETCVNRVREVRGKAKSLDGWLSAIEVDCAWRANPSPAATAQLAKTLESIEKKADRLLLGAQASTLRQGVIKGYLTLLERDVKGDRARAWRSVARLIEFLPYIDEVVRAALWRAAGELSFIQQKPEAAREFFRRSVAEVDSEELRVRIDAIDSALRNGGDANANVVRETRKVNPALEASAEELELVTRVTTALKSGDLLPAAGDAVKLIQQFPGGTRAKWAGDRLLEVYLNLADKAEARYAGIRAQVVKQMEKADSDRLAEWARIAYGRGLYADALTLSKQALKGTEGARSTRLLGLALESAIATDDFDQALEFSRVLIEKHAGTPSAREAMLRASLIRFRKKDYAAAVANLERLLVLPQAENLEIQARYWLWRSLERQGIADRANLEADTLMNRFPFSYYGLRAWLDRAGRVLDLGKMVADDSKKVESRLWLAEPERLAWERIQLMLKAGWLDEAQAELNTLPSPARAEDKAVRALLWAGASQYVNASRLVNQAWDEKRELRRPPFIRAAFPTEFADAVQAYAANSGLEASLVFGLMKQESGFNARAVSSSNALGVMQIIPPTAKEIAAELKIGELQLPEQMFEPERNIKMGTHYLAKMLAKFGGSVPLALAAYNAGPVRIERWLQARSSSLESLASKRSSAPEDEIWLDEIPYAETSFYVKAILRNVLLYRVLDQGRVEVPDPVWAFERPSR